MPVKQANAYTSHPLRNPPPHYTHNPLNPPSPHQDFRINVVAFSDKMISFVFVALPAHFIRMCALTYMDIHGYVFEYVHMSKFVCYI